MNPELKARLINAYHGKRASEGGMNNQEILNLLRTFEPNHPSKGQREKLMGKLMRYMLPNYRPTPANISSLPPEILQMMLSRLDPSSLGALAQTSKQMRSNVMSVEAKVAKNASVLKDDGTFIPMHIIRGLADRNNKDALVYALVSDIYAGTLDFDRLDDIDIEVFTRISAILWPFEVNTPKWRVLNRLSKRSDEVGKAATKIIESGIEGAFDPDPNPNPKPKPRDLWYVPLDNYKEVLPYARYVVCEWLVEVSELYVPDDENLRREILLKTVYLFGYICKIIKTTVLSPTPRVPRRSKLQAYGVLAFLIVSKFYNVGFTLAQASYVTDNSFTREELISIMPEILSVTPPISKLHIPDIESFLSPATPASRFNHVMMYALVRPVFGERFNPLLVLKDRRSLPKLPNHKHYGANFVDDRHITISENSCIYQKLPCKGDDFETVDYVGKINTEQAIDREVSRTPNGYGFPKVEACEPEYIPECRKTPHTNYKMMKMPYYGIPLSSPLNSLRVESFFDQMWAVLENIAHLHNNLNQYHMDIKPDNLLIQIPEKGEIAITIIDFGISLKIDDPMDNSLYSKDYRYWPLELKMLVLSDYNQNDLATKYVRFLKQHLNDEVKKRMPAEMFSIAAWVASINNLMQMNPETMKRVILERVDIWGFCMTVLEVMMKNPSLYVESEFNLCMEIMSPRWSMSGIRIYSEFGVSAP